MICDWQWRSVALAIGIGIVTPTFAQPDAARPAPGPSLSDARVLLDQDPGAALEQLERLHALPSSSREHQIELGLLLAQAYALSGRFAEANLLAESLAAAPDTDAAVRRQALAVRLQSLQGLQRFEDASRLASTFEDPAIMGQASRQVADTLLRLGERRLAATHLQTARAHFTRRGEVDNQLLLFPLEIDTLESLGRTAEALKLMREYKAVSDSLLVGRARTAAPAPPSPPERSEPAAPVVTASPPTAADEDTLLGAGLLVALVSLLALALIAYLLFRANRLLAQNHQSIEQQNQRLRALNAAVARHSREDPLTGLGNRLFLNEHLAAQAADGETEEPLLLILIDLDHFRLVNEQHGHAAGDMLLRQFADLLASLAAPGDQLVRWGGEEFIWLCSNVTAAEGPARCDQIRQRLCEQTFEHGGKAIGLSVSMGFAPIPVWKGSRSGWALSLRLADHAVYSSKTLGRNRWCGYRGIAAPPSEAAGGEWTAEALEEAGCVERLVDPHEEATPNDGAGLDARASTAPRLRAVIQ